MFPVLISRDPLDYFFPEKSFPCGSFSGPWACPGQKIGTIFCPKGGLAVINESKT
jgi:hypothetical protein